MRHFVVALGLCLLARTAEPRPTSEPLFAVVLGVNRPLGSTSPLLHADDDAILFHQFLGTVGYARLLTRPDRSSITLHGPLPEAQPPTGANLQRALDDLFAGIRRARAHGLKPHFFLIYSGHGAVRRGQAYLALLDGRFTASDLGRVLARSPAVTNHVIIDACHSYRLVHGQPPRQRDTRSSLAHRYPTTGFILSNASAERSHEWNELQAGVFSHEVRSALMGAADVNQDSRIAYDEMWGFLHTANLGVASARFRPRVHVRPPRGAVHATLLDLRGFRGSSISINQGGHYVLEEGGGARLADFHTEPGYRVMLRLPLQTRPDSVLCLHDLGRLMQYTFDREGKPRSQNLTDMPSEPSSYRVKGQPHSYSRIFARPFGPTGFRGLTTCSPASRGTFPCIFGQ